MKRTALALLLLTLAPVLFAETIRFDPPGLTAHRSVDAIVNGVWPNGCVPSVKNVVVDGSTIILHLNATPPPGVLCSQLVRPYALTFHLDVLPAGSSPSSPSPIRATPPRSWRARRSPCATRRR